MPISLGIPRSCRAAARGEALGQGRGAIEQEASRASRLVAELLGPPGDALLDDAPGLRFPAGPQVDPVEALFARPANRFVASLLGGHNVFWARRGAAGELARDLSGRRRVVHEGAARGHGVDGGLGDGAQIVGLIRDDLRLYSPYAWRRIREGDTLFIEAAFAAEDAEIAAGRAHLTTAEAGELARRIRDERELVFVHPYDDPEVIAGQGTVADQAEVEPDSKPSEKIQSNAKR